METIHVDSDKYTLADFLTAKEPDPFAKTEPFLGYIEDLRRKRAYSYHRLATSPMGNRATIRDNETGQDREFVVLSSNNYLGLNTRSEPIQAAREALAKYGTGMCGSRFLSGTYDMVVELERELAAFESTEAAMVFTTGYQANVGTLSALLRKGDVAFIDRLSHASIVDGCRIAGCRTRTFKHNDMDHLQRLLENHKDAARGQMIVAEGVFSMDGDRAPLPEIADLAKRYGVRLMVDEAHATGVLGANGRGAMEHFGLHGAADIVMGTFSKSLGATGGYIAGSRAMINYVRHYGRAYMFSASPTPATVASVLATLDIVRREPEVRERLWDNVRRISRGLKQRGFQVFPDPPESAILTIPIGADRTVHAMSMDLYEGGLYTSTVVYPAVSRDEGRLRLSISAAHTPDDLDTAVDVLAAAGTKHGIIRSAPPATRAS